MSTRADVFVELDLDGSLHFAHLGMDREVSYSFAADHRRVVLRYSGGSKSSACVRVIEDTRTVRTGPGDDLLPRALRWLVTGEGM